MGRSAMVETSIADKTELTVRSYDDAAEFAAVAEPFLADDEPRHHLMLGIVRTLVTDPDVYPRFHLWIVHRGEKTVGAALMTPPRLLALAAGSDETVECLAREIARTGPAVPGVLGGLPEAERFADTYVAAAGGRVTSRMEQAIYALESVSDVPPPPGGPRPARTDDIELVLDWYEAFGEEAGTGDPWDRDAARTRLAVRLAEPSDSGLWLWIDGQPVSLAGHVSPTPSGIRIGPVYTPPRFRRRGYATALVAALSHEMLVRGHRRCFLYTDLANTTSNAIYRRIGYRLVCPAAMIRFES